LSGENGRVQRVLEKRRKLKREDLCDGRKKKSLLVIDKDLDEPPCRVSTMINPWCWYRRKIDLREVRLEAGWKEGKRRCSAKRAKEIGGECSTPSSGGKRGITPWLDPEKRNWARRVFPGGRNVDVVFRKAIAGKEREKLRYAGSRSAGERGVDARNRSMLRRQLVRGKPQPTSLRDGKGKRTTLHEEKSVPGETFLKHPSSLGGTTNI